MEHNTHNGNKDDLAVILGTDIVVIYLCCWQKRELPEIKVFYSRNIFIVSHAIYYTVYEFKYQFSTIRRTHLINILWTFLSS